MKNVLTENGTVVKVLAAPTAIGLAKLVQLAVSATDATLLPSTVGTLADTVAGMFMGRVPGTPDFVHPVNVLSVLPVHAMVIVLRPEVIVMAAGTLKRSGMGRPPEVSSGMVCAVPTATAALVRALMAPAGESG